MQRAQTGHQDRKVLQTFVSIVFFLFAINLFYHLMHGDRGYFALKGIEEKLALADAEYQNIHNEKAGLEGKVKMLRPDSLDLDLLDEQARRVLGFAAPQERILLFNSP